MTNQVFNTAAKEHFSAAVITALNLDTPNWKSQDIRTNIDVDGFPFELTIKPSFYGDEKSIYLSFSLFHGSSEKQPRHLHGKSLCELQLSKEDGKRSPQVFLRTAESTEWFYTELDAIGTTTLSDDTLQETSYLVLIKAILAQFTQTFIEHLVALTDHLLASNIILAAKYQEELNEADERRKVAEEVFQQFMSKYRRVTDDEAEALQNKLEATGSVEFMVILRSEPKEAAVSITKTENGYSRTIGDSQRSVDFGVVKDNISKARIRL